MKLLMAGDVHGANGQITYLISKAVENDCDIIQLGDFGYWAHTSSGNDYIKNTSKKLVKANKKMYWLDGNHENHTLLRALYGPGGVNHDPTPEGFWKIRENLYYIPRATRWEWAGKKFLALGGAYSIDKAWRREGESWWPEELITYGEAKRATEGGRVDIMLSHDAPITVPLTQIVPGFFKDEENTNKNRLLLDNVVWEVKPKILFHGHYHHRYTFKLKDDPYTLIEGIGCENVNFNGRAEDSWTILDTDKI